MKWWPSLRVSLLFKKDIRMKGGLAKNCALNFIYNLKTVMKPTLFKVTAHPSPKSYLLVKI